MGFGIGIGIGASFGVGVVGGVTDTRAVQCDRIRLGTACGSDLLFWATLGKNRRIDGVGIERMGMRSQFV